MQILHAVCVVGKSWDFHVKVTLGIKNDENLENIERQLNILLKIKKSFFLMLSIFLMVSRQILNTLLNVYERLMIMELGGLYFVIQMVEPYQMKLEDCKYSNKNYPGKNLYTCA